MNRYASSWFAFRGQDLLVRVEEESAALPDGEAWEALGISASEPLHVGELREGAGYAVGLGPEVEPPPGMTFLGLRKLWGRLDEAAWRLAGRAVQIVEWDRNHRFCGRCGSETVPKHEERSRTCPSCGLQSFPRISPAVIVLVEDEDGRVLLARSPHFVPGVYSTLAGFVEPGESLEETVAREIREEVGVEVRDVRYFGSQPWPFPHSLMIGFTARYAGGEVRMDPAEIEDARWFTPDDLPLIPPKLSIARALIDDYLARHGRLETGREAVWR
ncbi:MAG TPA: NAD(+) diphosphatase [Thermoanaerobaculia bacterium]|nr:NAD(+) diphosphatase [Thermoanaerobaculia bacterium]